MHYYHFLQVRKSDYLPQKICSMCATTLLSFHQLYIICQSNNTRFLQSLEGEAYEHHVVKNQAVGDASELLELQSSFSREIENEILNMHGSSKEINEAESEIAANAAVKELERIGSAENISLVEEVIIDVIQSTPNDVHPDEVNSSKKSTDADAIKTENKSNQNNFKTEKKTRNKSKKEPVRRQTKTEEKTIKSKANAKSTVTAAAVAATTTVTKSRAIKSPKKSVKNVPKTEILKENITRSKSKSVERTAPTIPTNGKDVKENSCIDDDVDDDTQK